MPKNLVVVNCPLSPYHAGTLVRVGSTLNAPRGCLSIPTATTMSPLPATMALAACWVMAAPVRTGVEDVDERDAGETQQADERVGLGDLPAAAERAVDVGPRHTGVLQGLVDRVGTHLERALVAVAAEGVQADPDDRDFVHVQAPQLLVRVTGANANVTISSPSAFV